MNGRVYDYNIGRFMSVDPFVHEGSQGINPYSYMTNNPLSGTDPSGYEPEKEKLEILITGPLTNGDGGCCGEGGNDNSSQDGGSESNGSDESSEVPSEPEIVDIGSQKVTSTNPSPSSSTGSSGMGALAHFGGGGSSSKSNSQSSSTLDAVQTGLDIFGMIPIIGEAADLINAGISVARGDYRGAALSIAAMVPFVGNAATGIKLIRRASVTNKTTVLGENMMERVIPYADKTGASALPFGTTAEKWAKMTPKEKWKLNDGALRARINAGDSFKYIGKDIFRDPVLRRQFNLSESELLRLSERGIRYDTVSPSSVKNVIGRP